MADVPPWPNFPTLFHYHIIWYLLRLSALSSVFNELSHCRCIRQYVSMLHHLKLKFWKHYPPPRKKKPVSPRQPVTMAMPLTMFASAQIFYNVSCQAAVFCHKAMLKLTGYQGLLHLTQAHADNDNAISGAHAIRVDSVSHFIGVDDHTSFCKESHPDQLDWDLPMIPSYSSIGLEAPMKVISNFKFNTQDNTGQRKPMRAAPFIESIITPVGCSSFETQSYRTYIAVIEALRASTQQFCWDQVIQHPDHSPSIPESDEFMADGNLLLHANHYNRPSEGVYNNTVKFSNVASEGAPDSSTCTISTVDQDDELTVPFDKAKSMEKIMLFNKPWSSKNHRQTCPKPTFLTMIALAGCFYIYTNDCHAEILYHRPTPASSGCCKSLLCHPACATQEVAITPSASSVPCFITNHCDHLDNNPQLFGGEQWVTSIGYRIAIKCISTLQPKCNDYTGIKAHTALLLPKPCYHVPSLKKMLVASHHWTLEAKDHIIFQEGQCHVIQEGQCQAPLTCSASCTKSHRHRTDVSVINTCTPHFQREHIILGIRNFLTWQQLEGVSTLPLMEPSATVPSSHHSIKHAHPTAIHPAVDGEPQEPELPQESSTKPQASNLSTGVSSKGRVQKMTQAMADSIKQQCLFARSDWDLFARSDWDLFAQSDRDLFAQSDWDLTLVKVRESNKDQEHTAQLAIQDRMRHLVAFDVNGFILNKNLLLASDYYAQEMHTSVSNTECSHLPILPDSNKVITVGKQSSEGASTGSNTVITKHNSLEVFEGVPVQDGGNVHTNRRIRPVRPTLSILTAAKLGQFALDLDDHIYMKSTQVKLFTLTEATLILKHYQVVTVVNSQILEFKKDIHLTQQLNSVKTFTIKQAFQQLLLHASSLDAILHHDHAVKDLSHNEPFQATCKQGGKLFTSSGIVRSNFQYAIQSPKIDCNRLMHSLSQLPEVSHIPSMSAFHSKLPSLNVATSRFQQFNSTFDGINLGGLHAYEAPCLPYLAHLLPGGALPKWLLVRHSNVPEGNSIQQSGILCPTFLPANTTKYISVTSQICHAISVLSSLSTDCVFPFPFHEPVSEGVIASMHRTNLHPTDQMKPCNKRLTSWAYNHQSQVVFLFFKTHINPLSLLQRLYHNISSSGTVTSCTATNTYHVKAEGVSTTSINPAPTKAHVGLFASKEKPKLALNFN